MISEGGHRQKAMSCMTFRKGQSHEDRSQVRADTAWGIEEGIDYSEVQGICWVWWKCCGICMNVFICQKAPNSTFKLYGVVHTTYVSINLTFKKISYQKEGK